MNVADIPARQLSMRQQAPALLMLLMMMSTGCAVAPAPSTQPAPAPSGLPAPADPGAPPAAPRPETPAASPAVTALVEQAALASSAGDHDNAAALLERALRMEPRNAELWHTLAATRLRGGDDQQAEQFALRSLGLAGDRGDLSQRNWSLIAQARAQRGDTAGSQAARQRASAASQNQ